MVGADEGTVVRRPGRQLRRLPRRPAVPRTTGRALLAAGWLTIALGLAPSRAAADGTRVVTDSAGRRVVVPARIERVFAAGPPATVFVYTLAPDALLGWSVRSRSMSAPTSPPGTPRCRPSASSPAAAIR